MVTQQLINNKKRFLQQFDVDYSDIDFSQCQSEIQLDNFCKKLIHIRLDTKTEVVLKPKPTVKQHQNLKIKSKSTTCKKAKAKKKPALRRNEIIRLHERGCATSVICQIMDIYPQTVYSTLSRYRKQIKEVNDARL